MQSKTELVKEVLSSEMQDVIIKNDISGFKINKETLFNEDIAALNEIIAMGAVVSVKRSGTGLVILITVIE